MVSTLRGPPYVIGTTLPPSDMQPPFMYANWIVGGHCLTSALVLRDRGRLVRALVNVGRGPLEGVAYLEATASWHT